MDISTRLLALIIELVFVPSKIEDKKFRVIFDRISESHNINSYVSIGNNNVKMSSTKGKTNMVNYKISNDRILLSYEFCENSINYYIELIKDFLNNFSNITGISLFLMRNIIIRKLVNLPGVNDTRDFLIKDVFSLKEENLKRFERPLHLFGTRIFFPPIEKNNVSYDIKIETSLENPKTLFIENKAIFPLPLDINNNINFIKDDIFFTEKFINENILNFLLQFL